MLDWSKWFAKSHVKKNALRKGEVLSLVIAQISPTAPTFSEWETQQFVEEMRALLPKGSEAVRTHLQARISSVVVGPDSSSFLVGSPSFAIALNRVGVHEILVRVEKDWSDLSKKKCFKRLKSAGWLWASKSDIPAALSDLIPDRYLDIAWALKQVGAIETDNDPLQLYRWAEHMRQYFNLSEQTPATELQEAAPLLIELCSKKKSRHLPGYVRFRESGQEILVAKLVELLKAR